MPINCPDGTVYVIKSGDTFYSLAQRYNTTVEAIMTANPGVDPDNLQIGQEICIPVAPPPTTCPEGSFSYTIKAGDTLYSLARTYNTTVDAILQLNPGLDPNNLQVGRIICIPSVTPPPTTCPAGSFSYTIKAGDTLYSLAIRYNTTVDAILQLNPGINPNALQIGQQICIPSVTPPPSTCPAGSFSYTIKAGDTLYSLARTYNTTTSAIIQLNPGIDPNNLQIGQKICIPRVEPIPVPRPRVVVLNPTDLAPNAKASAFVETELGSVFAIVTNVPDPTVFPGGLEVYKLWVKVPGETTWHVTTMDEVYTDYWLGRVVPGVPLTGSDVVISAEKTTNVTAPAGVGVATGTL